jgi:hypothetical protein
VPQLGHGSCGARLPWAELLRRVFTEDGISVERISKQGDQPQVLVDSGTPVLSIGTGIAIDDQRIYFEFSQQFGSFSICSVAKTGGAITTIGTVNTLIPPSTYFAVDDTYVYFAGEVDDTIRRAPKAGGESIALVNGLVAPSATGSL